MKQLKQFVFGIILGIANVIPGVSGGTMAVILNIYDDILYAISWKHFRKHVLFLGILGAGMVTGIILFSHSITYLLENYHMPVYYSFMGLIIGSIPMIYKKAHHEKVKPRNLIVFALALVFMLLITFLQQGEAPSNVLNPSSLPRLVLYLWLFTSAIIASISMILPGISGSLVMLMLGTYTITIEAIANMDILTLLPICLGVLLGIFTGLKFVKTLLRYHPQALYFGILGLILGSLYSIYPGTPSGSQGALCLALTLLFSALAYLCSRK